MALAALTKGLRAGVTPAAAHALRRICIAVRDDDSFAAALRHLDRAWRCLPELAATLAPAYASLLLIEGSDDYAALGLLQRTLQFGPNPDAASLIALSLLRLERVAESRAQLHSCLCAYAVEPDGLLFQVAGAIALDPAVGAPGWVGRGARLELVGMLCANEGAGVLEVTSGEQVRYTQLLPRRTPELARHFAFAVPALGPDAPLEISVHGCALLGSPLTLPADFAFDGRATATGTRLQGWARLGWLPTRPLSLRVEDEHGRRARLRSASAAIAGGGRTFTANLRALRLRGSRIDIAARLPDGRWLPLPDSPLLLEHAVHETQRAPLRLRAWPPPHARAQPRTLPRAGVTDVIIPVYRGREETLACIDSVLATIGRVAHVVVVDDASDDVGLAAALDDLQARGRITLLRNATNQGFVASVNRGLALHPTHDAVLLNSDTLVFDDWLERLRAAAYRGRAVGTVTPLSNAGSIASYPHVRGAEVTPQFAAALHALARATHDGRSVEIPVGVGFCLYIRRDCLNAVGGLDAVFGKGYGEEVDFCLRARRRGWSQRLAADVYVWHAGGRSFGGRRAALLERSQRLLNVRYPGYDAFIASFERQDPLQRLRRRLDIHRLSTHQGRFVLLVTLAMSGGVERFVAERCREISAQGLQPLILRPLAAGDARHCELWTEGLELPNLRFDMPQELGGLSALLRGLRLEAIEIQHFLHVDARLIDAVRALPVPYDVFVHDYAWICPRVTLIDGSGRYCGEPAVSVCQRCVRRNGSHLGEAIPVTALRTRSERWLRGARRVLAPSHDTAERLRRHFPQLEVQVRPHAAAGPPAVVPSRPAQRSLLRVALLGAIGDHKGYAVLLACARDARARRLPLEFVVVGYTRDDAPLLATGKIFITGRYSETEALHLLRREQPDAVWLPSVWPETWCYALDHALASGLPVMAYDLGAIAERLRAVGAGELLPLESSPRAINDRFLHLLRPAVADVPSIVQLPHSGRDANAKMGTNALQETAMNNNTDNRAIQQAREQGMSASVQLLPLAPGLYLFSVKTAAAPPKRVGGELSLPAVHVGLGPGVRPEQVEFITGPATQGCWLFALGDLLVAKINGSGATLLMTSVRGPGGDVLAIKVERLESRAETGVQPAEPRRVEAQTSALVAGQAAGAPAATASDKPVVPVQIGAHVRSRGDLTFADTPWAGRVAPGLWIESFSVRPLGELRAQDLEYKGLTGSGFETPWLSDDKMCGTKGMAVPLVGFAVRLKASTLTADYDCEYSGYFQSGVTVGPLRNGAPCRSTVANDPLEGIQIRLLRRSAALPAAAGEIVAPTAAGARRAREKGVRKAHATASGAPRPRQGAARPARQR